jgi:hypothetical protein
MGVAMLRVVEAAGPIGRIITGSATPHNPHDWEDWPVIP